MQRLLMDGHREEEALELLEHAERLGQHGRGGKQAEVTRAPRAERVTEAPRRHRE